MHFKKDLQDAHLVKILTTSTVLAALKNAMLHAPQVHGLKLH